MWHDIRACDVIFKIKYTNSGAVRFDPIGNGRVGIRSHNLSAKKST
jgi:hypothetical protein